MRVLDPGYSSEVGTVEEGTWHQILQKFDDANIYQTWSYAAVSYGRRNMSHLILKKNGDVAAIAQARIAKLPFLNIGIAYIRWGPLWRHRSTGENPEIFRQAIRALRNEFAFKRHLVLRLFPHVFECDAASFLTILTEEGFSLSSGEARSRTILMDLSRSLEELRGGMGRNWKRNLRSAERGDLEVIDGSEPAIFGAVLDMYTETISRKKFISPTDLSRLTEIQTNLPDDLTMGAMLCRSGGEPCAGLIWSAMGRSAVELVAATTSLGLRTNGSYLLRWKLVEKLKQRDVAVYNLNGINPTTNPGTYHFKSGLAGKNGRDVYYLGRFDSRSSLLSYSWVKCGDGLRRVYRKLREIPRIANGLNRNLAGHTDRTRHGA